MVGNNAREDMAATQLGCDGYLVTDGLLNPENVDINQFRNGTMAQFRAFVDSLPECEAWQ
ncbi:MAG: HAD family hydrolase, partial [Eggerthellales bacterium]|nr:HAD family hydrolase [Eggerthellales bacterium]